MAQRLRARRQGRAAFFACLILAIVAWAMPMSTSHAARIGVNLELVSPGEVTVDERFDLALMAEAFLSSDGGEVEIRYDASYFRYESMTQAGSVAVSATAAEGRVTLRVGAVAVGSQSLATLVFRATAPGGGRFTIEASRFTRGGELLPSTASIYSFVQVRPRSTATVPPIPGPEPEPPLPTGPEPPPPIIETVTRLPDEPDEHNPPAPPPESDPVDNGGNGSDDPERTTELVTDQPDGPRDTGLTDPAEASEGQTTSTSRHTMTGSETGVSPTMSSTTTRPLTPVERERIEEEEMLVIAKRLERIVPLILIPIIVIIVGVLVALIIRRRP